MMRRDFRISFLIVKELLGGLPDKEQRELSMWKESHNPLYERLHKPENAGEHAARLSRFPADEAKAAAVILPVLLLAGLCIALFDVISSDVPFLVSTPEMEIEVLGTLFDVSAYAGDATRAVLVEGSVRVSHPGVRYDFQ